MDFSLTIGIDKYLDLNETPFAENDANGFHSIMVDLYKVEYNVLLLRDKATYASIKRNISDIASRIENGDRFFLFFAGHGENIKSKPFISCYDTYPRDNDTWISIIEIIEQFSQKGCNKNILFIDACESTIKFGSRKNITKFSLEELENNSLENSYSSVYSSTSHKGIADVNTVSKHGIWSHFLLKALAGEDEKALNNELWLTNNTLQNYLSISVKQFCKSDPKVTVQNSFKWGKEEGEYIIHKFEKKEISKYKTLPQNVTTNVFFMSSFSENVKSLSGFNKGSHTVPKFSGYSTEKFIQNISKEEIENHIEEVSKNLRDLFGLKSRDFKLTFDDGSATFECPYFMYTYGIELNERDLSEVFFHAELHPTNLEKIIEYSDDFDECFPKWFRDLVYYFTRNINIEELIEKIEEVEENTLVNYEYDYDSSKTFVSLYSKKLNRSITIFNDKLEIKFQVKETVPSMIEGLKEISNELLGVSSDYKLLG